MKEEISGNVVEIRRKSDRVMAIVLSLCSEVMRIICAYGPQSGRPDAEKVHFYDEMWGASGTWKVQVKSLFLFRILMDLWANVLKVSKMYTGGMVLGKEMQKE